MARLEFRNRETGRLIARAELGVSWIIPAAGDVIYAPSAEDTGVYSHQRVAGRQFFYDQQGHLSLVALECIEVPSQPVAVPSRRDDGLAGLPVA